MAAEIIGRRDELLALESFLAAAPAGGQALLLEGDAGIGKTVLWEEALRLAGERGFRVLRSRPTQSEAQVAFAAIGDLLAPALSGVVQRLAPVQRHALETALLLREPDGVFPDTRVLGVALLSTVRALAAERPVLVALDDAQWLDASSAEVLTFMLRRLDGDAGGRSRDGARAARCGAARTRPHLRCVPAACDRAALGRSDPSAAVGPVRDRGAAARDHAGPQDHRGNPFFALELGRALVEGSIRAEDADVELPESLRAVVAQRLGALPARVRETLVAVAALASPSMAPLEALGGSGVDDIELAQRRGVVEFDGERIRFAHPLLAPACYEAMPLHRRRRLHQTPRRAGCRSRGARPPSRDRGNRPRRKRSRRRWTPRRRTPVRAAPLRPRPTSPSARSR